MELTKVRDILIVAWLFVSLTVQVWGFAQQTLVAQSQAAQQIQRAQGEAQNLQRQLEAERARVAVEQAKNAATANGGSAAGPPTKK